MPELLYASPIKSFAAGQANKRAAQMEGIEQGLKRQQLEHGQYSPEGLERAEGVRQQETDDRRIENDERIMGNMREDLKHATSFDDLVRSYEIAEVEGLSDYHLENAGDRLDSLWDDDPEVRNKKTLEWRNEWAGETEETPNTLEQARIDYTAGTASDEQKKTPQG